MKHSEADEVGGPAVSGVQAGGEEMTTPADREANDRRRWEQGET